MIAFFAARFPLRAEDGQDVRRLADGKLQLAVTIDDEGSERRFSLLLYRVTKGGKIYVATRQTDIERFLLPQAETILDHSCFSKAQQAKLQAAARLDIARLWREYARLHAKIHTGHRPAESVLNETHHLRARLQQPFSSNSLFDKLQRTLLTAGNTLER